MKKTHLIFITLFAFSVILNLFCLGIYINEHAFAKCVPVLLYHDVDKIENLNKYWPGDFTTTEEFEKQMAFLKKHHYKTITLDELYKFVLKKKKLPKRSVLITFDGGRTDILNNAYPILKKYKFTATYFLLTSKIAKEEMYMNEEELNKIKDVFEFASHTYDLHYKIQDKDNKKVSVLLKTPKLEIIKDLEKSKRLADKPYFAYPYGKYNEEAIQALKDANYIAAFALKGGVVKPGDDLYKLRRNTINYKTSFKKFQKIIRYKQKPKH